MSERLLTARDVAERVGVSTETVLRWTRRGVLGAIRLPGGALRFRPAELDAKLNEWSAGAMTRGVSTTPGDARACIVPLSASATRNDEEEDDDAC